MIYVTIIVVALIIAFCILTYKYLSCTYNEALYEPINTIKAKKLIESQLIRCQKYENAEGNERYEYSISQNEIKGILLDLALFLDINTENYE